MEKDFVPYEIALELKQLGFDEPCLFAYNQDDDNKLMTAPQLSSYYINTGKNSDIGKINKVTVPTLPQAFRWFREKYGLVIEPCVPFQRLYSTEDDYFEILEFGYRIYSFDQYRGGLRDKIEWDGYDNSNEEKAELECLKKLIEIVKEK